MECYQLYSWWMHKVIVFKLVNCYLCIMLKFLHPLNWDTFLKVSSHYKVIKRNMAILNNWYPNVNGKIWNVVTQNKSGIWHEVLQLWLFQLLWKRILRSPSIKIHYCCAYWEVLHQSWRKSWKRSRLLWRWILQIRQISWCQSFRKHWFIINGK